MSLDTFIEKVWKKKQISWRQCELMQINLMFRSKLNNGLFLKSCILFIFLNKNYKFLFNNFLIQINFIFLILTTEFKKRFFNYLFYYFNLPNKIFIIKTLDAEEILMCSNN